MKRFITFITFQILLTPFALIANENFSVEIEALTLVMEQYKTKTETETESDLKIKKPTAAFSSYFRYHDTKKIRIHSIYYISCNYSYIYTSCKEI